MNEFEIYQDALRLCERGELASSRSVADAYFRRAIDLLEELVQQVPNSNRFHQLLGICWYNFSEKGEQRNRGIADHLNRAFAIKPGEQLTIAHLVYFNYEQGRYQQALDLLEQVSYDYFRQRGQSWRNLKYDELKLCCRLRLTPSEVSVEDVEAFFLAFDNQDPEFRQPPSQLEECTGELSSQLAMSPEGKAVLAALNRGLDLLLDPVSQRN